MLYSDGHVWKKSADTDLFDIPMGSYHGAEVCDLIGLFILDKLQSILPDGEFGLYRDDGLAVIDDGTAIEMERISKTIRSVMSGIGFKITIEAGAKITNFLDITLDLRNNRYHPFRKENSRTSYIHCKSNHPFHIKKEIPKMVQKRLSSLSKDQQAFEENKDHYEEALAKSGYKEKLSFDKPNGQNQPKRRTRRKKAIFFNAPFCSSTKTNIGKEFFKLVNHHFKKDHPYHSIFNRNTIKLSYSCMRNVRSIIQSHNRKVLEQANGPQDDEHPSCNCRKKPECPLDGNCLTSNVIYKATVTTSNGTKDYIGSTGGTFKKRFYGHKHSFAHPEKRSSTELSKYVWSAKDRGEEPKISWSIVHRVKRPGDSAPRICSTCNLERIAIAMADRRRSLNTRSELTGACVHFRKSYF